MMNSKDYEELRGRIQEMLLAYVKNVEDSIQVIGMLDLIKLNIGHQILFPKE